MKRPLRGAHWWGAVALAGHVGAAGAHEALPGVHAKAPDPFSQCAAVAAALPKSLKALRQLAAVQSLKTSRDVAEYCDTRMSRCRRVTIAMPGLKADLIEDSTRQALAPLAVELTSSRWRLMDGVHVGQDLPALLAFYGVQAPQNEGAFNICGEVACLAVRHRDDRVTGLGLDCQRAW